MQVPSMAKGEDEVLRLVQEVLQNMTGYCASPNQACSVTQQ